MKCCNRHIEMAPTSIAFHEARFFERAGLLLCLVSPLKKVRAL